tara:strand:- start:4060 stop:4254 length:195 start_codon:yes stop_codon:yes gene_type:complete
MGITHNEQANISQIPTTFLHSVSSKSRTSTTTTKEGRGTMQARKNKLLAKAQDGFYCLDTWTER